MWKKNLVPILTSIFLLGASLVIGKNAEDSLIRNLVIISAIAIDMNEEDFLVTVQAINAPAVKETASENLGFILYQESGRTITEALQNIHKTFSRFLFLDDLEVILVSEELAKNRGIEDVVNYLFLEQTISSNTMLFVSKGVTAHNILAMFTPFQKVSSWRIVDTIENIRKYSSFAYPVYPNRVKNYLLNYPVVNNVIPYISISGDVEEGLKKENIEAYQPKSKMEISGMSYFSKDKLTGFLNVKESKDLLFLMDKVKEGALESNCPEDPGYFTYHHKKGHTSYKVDWAGETPAITINIKIDGRIIESTCQTSFEFPNMDLFRQQIKADLKDSITELIKKSQAENLDYVGFAKELYLSEPQKWREVESNWANMYPTLPFDINIDVSIQRSGDATRLE